MTVTGNVLRIAVLYAVVLAVITAATWVRMRPYPTKTRVIVPVTIAAAGVAFTVLADALLGDAHPAAFWVASFFGVLLGAGAVTALLRGLGFTSQLPPPSTTKHGGD